MKTPKKNSESDNLLSIPGIGAVGVVIGIGLGLLMENIVVGISIGLVLSFFIALVYKRTIV